MLALLHEMRTVTHGPSCSHVFARTPLRHYKLVTGLLVECARGDASRFAPWMKVLPTTFGSAPLFFSQADIDAIQDVESRFLVTQWRDRDTLMVTSMAEVCAPWFDTEFKGLVLDADVVARAFHLVLKLRAAGSRSGAIMITPLIDMVNHSSAPNAICRVQNGFTELICTADIGDGDEIFIDYQRKVNTHVSQFYINGSIMKSHVSEGPGSRTLSRIYHCPVIFSAVSRAGIMQYDDHVDFLHFVRNLRRALADDPVLGQQHDIAGEPVVLITNDNSDAKTPRLSFDVGVARSPEMSLGDTLHVREEHIPKAIQLMFQSTTAEASMWQWLKKRVWSNTRASTDDANDVLVACLATEKELIKLELEFYPTTAEEDRLALSSANVSPSMRAVHEYNLVMKELLEEKVRRLDEEISAVGE
jgi:hypothetical protein